MSLPRKSMGGVSFRVARPQQPERRHPVLILPLCLAGWALVLLLVHLIGRVATWGW